VSIFVTRTDIITREHLRCLGSAIVGKEVLPEAQRVGRLAREAYSQGPDGGCPGSNDFGG
jgi:hypothetical protein